MRDDEYERANIWRVKGKATSSAQIHGDRWQNGGGEWCWTVL